MPFKTPSSPFPRKKMLVVGELSGNNLQFTWEIPEFSSLFKSMKGVKDTSTINSPEFSFGLYIVQLQFVPYRQEDKSDEFCSIALHIQSFKKENTEQSDNIDELVSNNKVTICILDKNRQVYWSLEDELDHPIEHDKSYFMSNKLLEKCNFLDHLTNLLSNDCLHITCKIEIDKTNRSRNPRSLHEQQKIFNFNEFLNNDLLHDVELVTKSDLSFYAHKVILAAKSPVFKTLILENMSEPKPVMVIDVEDLDEEALLDILEFMYTGKIEDFDQKIIRITPAACRYEIDDLREMCENLLIKSLNVNNAVEYLLLAHANKIENLKIAAISKVATNVQILKTNKEQWEKIGTDLFTDILETYNFLNSRKRKHSED